MAKDDEDDKKPENIKKKLDDFNEHMLKATAVTFSMEGITRDLEVYIQKKMTFNNRAVKHFTDLIRFISETENPEIIKAFLQSTTKKPPTVMKLLEHLAEEIVTTNSMLNFIIQRVLEKEVSMNKEMSDSKHTKNKKEV